jgi:hypothetical protein
MSTRMQGFERETLNAVWQSKRVWLTHIIVNGALMFAFFFWLKIHDTNGGMFALTVIWGLVIAFATLSLHGATFDFFRRSPRVFTSSLRRAASHFFPLLIWAAIFGYVLWFIGHLWDYDEQIGGWARHALPGFIRGHVSPRSVMSAATGLIGFLFFFLWPIIFLPIGSLVASKGFRGFFTAAAFRPFREVRFWAVYIACFVVGAYLPHKLAWMTPTKSSSLNAQTWSMLVRLGVAYLLLVTAWMIVCAAIGQVTDGEVEVEAATPVPLEVAPV